MSKIGDVVLVEHWKNDWCLGVVVESLTPHEWTAIEFCDIFFYKDSHIINYRDTPILKYNKKNWVSIILSMMNPSNELKSKESL